MGVGSGVGTGVVGTGVGVAVGASVCTGGGRVGRGAATVATGVAGTGASGAVDAVGARDAVAGCAPATAAGDGVANDGTRAVDVAGGAGGEVAAAAAVGVGVGGSASPQPAARSAVPPARRATMRRLVTRAGSGMRGACLAGWTVAHYYRMRRARWAVQRNYAAARWMSGRFGRASGSCATVDGDLVDLCCEAIASRDGDRPHIPGGLTRDRGDRGHRHGRRCSRRYCPRRRSWRPLELGIVHATRRADRGRRNVSGFNRGTCRPS